MVENDYKDKIEIAQKAIAGLNLDPELKKIAFSKIIDDLLGKKEGNKPMLFLKKVKRKGSEKGVSESTEKEEDILSQINAEDFPHIHTLSSKLDLALYLLKVLRDKEISDGLIPSQIAKILTYKFRIKANQFNTGMAMSKARELLDRDKIKTRGGIAYKYKIMKKGEDYLNDVLTKAQHKEENTEE
jgi:D-serine dehydratase